MFLIVYTIIISSKRLHMSSFKSLSTHHYYDLPILFDDNYCSRSIVIKEF